MSWGVLGSVGGWAMYVCMYVCMLEEDREMDGGLGLLGNQCVGKFQFVFN